jgi:hypothetical protein
MVKPFLTLLCVLAAPVFATGCAVPVDHPSLAPRAVERFTVTEPSPPPPSQPAIPEDASLQERATALVAQARTADARFRERLADAKAMVANGSGAAIGTEAWVQAQQAVSRVDVLREPVARSLADLDALQVSSAEKGIGTDTETALSAALNDVASIDTAQGQAIASLKQQLSTP